ncbi:hypothetical protein [Laspinema olomoucense]|uniref:Uncharacterized protein n=2 Tax=Laspinema TaxID=2584823 RepID=A0ABT2N346_9CYAN|nr:MULTISPECIES: hypothetical protein [unclassified Laspinema]MCT7974592.1 hypothetical protein [Laspinema sp. D3d]MCT7977110.1 hypothetical protein [Laspinema sp. D3b]
MESRQQDRKKRLRVGATSGGKIGYYKIQNPLVVCPSMQNRSFINQLMAAGILSVAIAPWLQPVVKARETVPLFLFDTQCVTNGPGRLQQETLDISVGRKVYRSYFFLGPGSRAVSVTCRIGEQEGQFESLLLEFGMRDNDRGSPPNAVNIYLDGVRQESHTISPGEQVALSLNITNASHVAIETVCSTQNRYCDRVYFFESTLLPRLDVAPSEPNSESPNQI